MATELSDNEIVVVGELNVDLIANGLSSKPLFGQEILAQDFEITLGSASAIFASGAAKLGRKVTFISRLGNDDFGRFCLESLQQKDISTNYIDVNEASKTGVTIVLSTPRDRALVTYLGAIAELSLADISFDALENHKHLHLTSYFLQTGLQPDFAFLMREAKQRGLSVSFDPNSDPMQNWDEKIYDVIAQADILFLNDTEARHLTRQENIESAIRQLGEYCPTAVIKLGKDGAVGINDGKIVKAEGFTIDAIDTTGAGDSFAAGFVHAYLDKKDLRECLKTGNACGALSTTRAGGTAAQPNDAQLETFLKGHNAAAV